MNPLAARRPRSIPLALLAIALGGWGVAGFVEDRQTRESASDFARRYTLDQRRPLETAAMALERSADGATAIAVDAALEDVRGQAAPPDLDPALRQVWAESARSIGPELLAARALTLDALGTRPGRAQHRFLLGQIAYAEAARTRSAAAQARQWITPLSLAGDAAPGLDPIFTFLGSGYIENWPGLSPEERSGATAVLKRAFQDPAFVSRSLLPASTAVGRDEVLGLLPDDALPLRKASDAFAGAGDLATAFSLRPRLDVALRRLREQGIERIAQRRASGDFEGARSACIVWLQATAGNEFDDPAGRAQTARVLELWPNDVVGPWRSDPRGEFVRFFLAHREADVKPEALARAVESLAGVPGIVRARVRLLAGDPDGAEEIRRRSGKEAAFEWTPYVVDVALQRLARGDPKGAQAMLASLSASSSEGCDVLLARRAVATALPDQQEMESIEERLKRLRRDAMPAEAWSAGGSISLCLAGGADRRMQVAIEAPSDAIVDYGWNGGRQGSVLVPRGSSVLLVPLPASTGRQTFSVSTAAGGPIRPGVTSLLPGT